MVDQQHGSETSPETRLGSVRPPGADQPAAVRGGPRYEGAPLAEAAARFGDSPAARASLARDFRAGKLALFAEPGRPGRKSAPKKDAARGRVVELRRQGLSVPEISARLAAEGRPLNRTGVGQVLAEEGFGRLLRHPEPEASLSPATAARDTT